MSTPKGGAAKTGKSPKVRERSGLRMDPYASMSPETVQAMRAHEQRTYGTDVAELLTEARFEVPYLRALVRL